MDSRAELNGEPSKEAEGTAPKLTFWKIQPVVQTGDGLPTQDGAIVEMEQAVKQYPKESYPLPEGLEWSLLDLAIAEQADELYELLRNNYVEFNGEFCFHYSLQSLLWVLCPPGYLRELHIGVRDSSTRALMAFISGVPVQLRVRERRMRCSAISFLCVHKQIRTRRLAPLLINEISRACVHLGILQAVHMAVFQHSIPSATVYYYYRLLNIPKLVKVGFHRLGRGETIARLVRLNPVPTSHAGTTVRAMRTADMEEVHGLYTSHFRRFGMAAEFTANELEHYLLGGVGSGHPTNDERSGRVVWAYVTEDPMTHRIVNFFSFFSLPITVIKSNQDEVVDAAYLFYYASDAHLGSMSDPSEVAQMKARDAVHDAVVQAAKLNFDVVIASTCMENSIVLPDLKFAKGNDLLQYYLYNWRTTPLAGSDEHEWRAEEQVGFMLA